ncbi:unnamed protein product [Penicillium olsonii]|uniref:Uncharacterized protein n=1 Tax=Penicillium olsonii TaxID=99116 RepID=A0A9W4I7Y5_PENOL|nr:unnamed protein product [Penicillium olsonii]
MALLKSAAAKLPEISLSIQLLLILVIVIRRVFFHPLSGYPGPWLAAVTCWHPAYYAWKGTLHAYNRRCHDRYGPVFRSSVNELSFETPKGLDDIYTGSHEVIGKPDRWQCFSVDPREPTILSTVNNEQHRFKHQIISKIFASGMTSRNEARMRPHIDRFLEQLGAGDHDVQDLCDWLSLDIISDLLYGESLSLLCSAEYRWVGPAYRHMSRWIMTVSVLGHTPVGLV